MCKNTIDFGTDLLCKRIISQIIRITVNVFNNLFIIIIIIQSDIKRGFLDSDTICLKQNTIL